MPDDTNLPTPEGSDLPMIVDANMPPALRLWLDDRMFNRARLIASYIAKAEGVTPRHLIGKPEACFAVVEIALTWRMSPSAVARCTYQTPGGQLGYYGALCQAVLENSGKLDGGVEYEHYGPWEKVQGKFEYVTNDKGNRVPRQGWKEADEAGVGVIVRAQIKGEVNKRELRFDLRQAHPRNSTLWATDPMTQIKYTSCRRFATSVAPGIFMGIPFDWEGESHMVDVTPRPQREDYVERTGAAGSEPATEQQSGDTATAAEPAKAKTQREQYEVVDAEGEVQRFSSAAKATSAFEKLLEQAAARGGQALEDLWEANGLLLSQLRETNKGKTADALVETYRQQIDEVDKQARAAADARANGKKAETSTAAQNVNQPREQAEPAKPKEEPKREEPKAAAKPAGVPWTWKHSGYLDNPTSPLSGGGRMRYVSWISDMLREMPENEVEAFLVAQAKEISFYREKLPDDHRKLSEIARGRGFSL
jgi:hypothetical protein